MKENNLPELKPCPFCGGKANLIGASDAYFSMCSECGAESAIETTRSAVIAAWNKRADTSAIAANASLELADRAKREGLEEALSGVLERYTQLSTDALDEVVPKLADVVFGEKK